MFFLFVFTSCIYVTRMVNAERTKCWSFSSDSPLCVDQDPREIALWGASIPLRTGTSERYWIWVLQRVANNRRKSNIRMSDCWWAWLTQFTFYLGLPSDDSRWSSLDFTLETVPLKGKWCSWVKSPICLELWTIAALTLILTCKKFIMLTSKAFFSFFF